MDLDLKTYDDLPSNEKISLNFASQGICLAISTREATAESASTFAGCLYKARYAGIVIGKHPSSPISTEKFSLLFLLTSLMVLVRRMYVSIK